MRVEDWLPELEARTREVGAFQLEGARALLEEHVDQKTNAAGEDSVVTRWDTESEARLRDAIHAVFPSHSFLGEETGNDVRDPEHYWLVDPIDGTTNFTLGIPYWGPSVAYWRGGRPHVAVVFFPVLDRMYVATAGGGARCNGHPIHASRAQRYSLQTPVALHSRSHLRHFLHLRVKVRILGSIISNMCGVADGTFVAAAGRGRLWDLAAGVLLMREAGAVVDVSPDLAGIDLERYMLEPPGGRLFELYARAHAGLPRLQDSLEDIAPPSDPA